MKIFGTDGVRGQANSDLTPELAFKLGRAAAYILNPQDRKKAIVIGKDTRISGDMLESALIAGICSAGVNVLKVGVMPTPGIAFLTRKLGAMAGVVISASHNPAGDNGIKFFNHQGFKLPDEIENKIETTIAQGMEEIPYPIGADIGKVEDIKEGSGLYKEFLRETVDINLDGLKVVIDCANGAAYLISPSLFRELGVEVISIFEKPDGLNINKDCGSTHMESLKKAVLENRAHLGIAYDGDSDRMLAVDELGNIVDGDQILVICGLELQKQGLLTGNKVVGTVMSNLGLKQAFEKSGIEVEETKVGDRYVLEKMQETGAVLGGEQSGHIIFLNYNTTGDGILTALKLLEVVKKSGRPLSQLAQQMERLPQILVNVRVKDKSSWQINESIQNIIKEYDQKLGKRGRVLVRASGTEALIRVMAEGNDLAELEQITQDIAEVIAKELK
ncbi:MAG: phosphoglucosamine mutase [Clostridiaceae bacterium BRH_c20a]|nr:MAG: phosphoglucosamine mutase [Clostridiaceae bacterium BRH_c20a]